MPAGTFVNIHKIVEINPNGVGFFMKYLKYLSEQKKWSWTFESHPEFSEDILKGASAVKVEPSLSPQILPRLKVVPSQVRELAVLDSFFQENGTWYPRLLLYEALRLMLVAEAPDLDIRMPAFIVGDNEESRVVVSVLADMGVAKFYLVGDPERLNLEKEFLLRSQLGIRVQILRPEDLTMQALSAGITANTMDLSSQKSLMMDLSYFNFMKQKGYVLDLNSSVTHNVLLDEAERAGLKALAPVLVAQVFTRLWLNRLDEEFSDELSDQEIQDSWTLFLKEISSSV